jgi:integrase
MPRRQTPRLSEALAEYEIVRSTHLAKTTLQNDHSVLTRFIKGVGDPQAHLLTDRAVELYFAGEATRQAASSFNKVRTRVNGFMQFLQRRGWLGSNPLEEVRTRRVIKRERLRLSAEEIAQMITEAIRPRDRIFLAAAVNLGLRASDLTNLRIGDVDLDNGTIHILVQKTGREDQMPITAELDAELRTWLALYSEQVAAQRVMFPDRDYELTVESYLLPPYWQEGYDGASHLSPNRRMTHPARIVQDALERLGYPTKGEGVHTIRRSTARLLFEHASAEGHDGALRVAAALLGHKSTVTTEGYLGINADRIKRDALLRGRSFLTPTPPGDGVVVKLRRTS